MKKIFPPEIINHSIEMHFYNNSKPFKLIYFAIVILVVTSIAILPFITINITSQSRGIVRTQYESSQILSATAGQVKMINIAEGQKVMAGDTLLELLTENLQEQIKLAEIQLSENQTFITDLNALISEGKTIRSARYNIEQTQYLANINEMLVEMDLLKKEFDIAEHLHKEKVIAEMEY